MSESEELKNLLMKVKEESEKAGLKLNIQKMKIMASALIISQQKDGETIVTVIDFIFLGSKITADVVCSHQVKRWSIAPWKKSYDQPRQCIKKQRHHFANKGPYSQSYGFFWKRWEYQTTWPASWEICMQVRKQQLELDMEQQTGSK